MLLQLARTGNHNGEVLTLSDLKELKKNFTQDVPIPVGHTFSDKEPSYGWVKSVTLDEDNGLLMGDIDLIPEMQDLYDKGVYKKWSIGARKNQNNEWYLHHLALLGATPPKIKGLKELNLSDSKEITSFVFEDSETKKDENKSQEEKEQMNETEKMKKEMEELKKQNEKLEKLNKDFSDKAKADRMSARETKREVLRKVMEKKVPKEKADMILEFSDKIQEIDKMDFSDDKKRDFFDVMTELVECISQPVKEGEMDFYDNDESKTNIEFDYSKV